MKINLLFAFFILVTTAISAQAAKNKNTATIKNNKNVIHITDNKSFEVTFNDDYFHHWLKKQSPKSRYLQSSLEIENLQYSSEWNRRVNNPDYDSNLYVQHIDYQIKPRKHYGMNVNYELYMYFQYFEEKYEKLLIRG